ncbi:MAG: hypothetical protein EZS28_015494 [Streblomastix strix]|uniref:C2 domain-containing protein n=1 Tax=Streblomastix strix TaxID=222440 RepID=A0A5J4W377_9EUKA|nr:MAG: hypothetical protein EZS28_015494 [Streblomastix strix]
MAQRRLRKIKDASEQDDQEEEPTYEEEEEEEEEDLGYVNGIIKIKNISVRNLKKMDLLGKSDPYVVFKAGDEEKHTTTVRNKLDYDYVNEEYDLIYNPLKMQGKKDIEVEVYDYDVMTNNDIIGAVNVDILPALNKETRVELFLQPKNDVELKTDTDQKLGKVIFTMIYIPEDDYLKKLRQKELIRKKTEQDLVKQREFEEKSKIEELEKIGEEKRRIAEEERTRKEALDAQYIKGVVKFKNISVRNLKKMDLIGKSDPFVVFKAGESSKQTTTASNVTDYDYSNEEYEVVYDPAEMEGKHSIAVEVYDQDSITKNDLIGAVNIDILPSLNNETQIDLFLQPKKDDKEDETKPTNSDQKLGKVIFSVIYIPEQEWIENNEKEQQLKAEQVQEIIKNKEFDEKSKIEELEKIGEEKRRIAEEERIRKEALDAQYIKGVVKFKNISVRNLKKMDLIGKSDPFVKMDLIGKSDPFVVFKAGESSKQTTTASNVTDYDYSNEEYEVVYDPAEMEGKHSIAVEVYDQDSITKNDLIGAVNIDILPSLNNETQIDLFLQPKKDDKEDETKPTNSDQKLGKVIFSMIYLSEQEWNNKKKEAQNNKQRKIGSPSKSKQQEQELKNQKERELKAKQKEDKKKQKERDLKAKKEEKGKKKDQQQEKKQAKELQKLKDKELKSKQEEKSQQEKQLIKQQIYGFNSQYQDENYKKYIERLIKAQYEEEQKIKQDQEQNSQQKDEKRKSRQVKGPISEEAKISDQEKKEKEKDELSGDEEINKDKQIQKRKQRKEIQTAEQKQQIVDEEGQDGERKRNKSKGKQQPDKKEKEFAGKYVKGVVTFSNIQVRNIKKMDLVGQPDPYVIFKLGGAQKKTSVAKDQKDHVYLNESYDLNYDPASISGKVVIQVWDYDTFGKDDLIGVASVDVLPSYQQRVNVELDLQPLKKKVDQLTEEDILQLINQKADKGLGKVLFEILYQPNH